MISLQQLNTVPAEHFVQTLCGIFEHSPWVAARVLPLRPFRSRLQLHQSMCKAVAEAGADEQLALIRAHPELAGRAALRQELTPESSREQKGAGLDQCSPEEFAQLHALNSAYQNKFGFPFVLAVRGHDRHSILAAFAERLQHEVAAEQALALEQIGRIAGFRLCELVSAPAGTEIMAMLDALARHSEQADGLTCSYLSPAHRAVAAELKDWMLAAGLEVDIDAVANVVGRWRCGRPAAKTLITGSHYDTVVNAGRYDGRLGIVLPIVVALELRQQGLSLPYDLEIVGFAEEEGVRFKSTFLGSSALTGQFDAAVLQSRDQDGVTMETAMRAAGLDPAAIPALARRPEQLLGFVEVHIEQGPVLLDAGEALGVVTSIAGSSRFLLTVTGLAGHSGTVPMHLRRDAAAAAAEIVLAVESVCAGLPGLVGTVGRLEVPGGAVNVIPGRCALSLDIRAAADAVRLDAVARVFAAIEAIAARRQVEVASRQVLEVACAPCAPHWQAQWAASIRRAGSSPVPAHLPSGAGHDAMKMAALTTIGMLFVRCGSGGISHHPLESLDEGDAAEAASVFRDFLLHVEPGE